MKIEIKHEPRPTGQMTYKIYIAGSYRGSAPTRAAAMRAAKEMVASAVEPLTPQEK